MKHLGYKISGTHNGKNSYYNFQGYDILGKLTCPQLLVRFADSSNS